MNTQPTLLCTVRNCGLPLTRDVGRVFCTAGHSFDISRRRYINLLQPQDRRSKNPGDSTQAVAARRNIHDRGITQPLLDQISEIIDPKPADTALDIGAGDGFYLGNIQHQSNCNAAGIDISLPAIQAAANRYPACEWIVANADRAIPYAAESFSLLLSLTARMNPSESHRVLQPSGRLLIALPAPDDLIELRGTGRQDRVQRTVTEFAPHFNLIQQRRATTTAHLEPEAIQQILLSIYRPHQTHPPSATRVTFSLDLLLFQPVKLTSQKDR